MSPLIRRRGHTLAGALAAALVMVLLTACTGLPESGPITEVGSARDVDQGRPSDINAVPPEEGASSVEIVRGFLDAMTASPVSVEVARQFLASSAADRWNPDLSTITYGALQPVRDEGVRVSVPLINADRLDGIRAWKGSLGEHESTLRFTLTREKGEWRITDPPDALIVPTSWFTQRFQQAVIYLFDPSGRILVPEPVYVPRGEQLVTSLVNALVAREPVDSGGAVISYVPVGLSSEPVPVTAQGVAEVSLDGESAALAAPAAERLLAQLAWTLKQAPRVQAIRVMIGDRPVLSPSGGAEYRADAAQQFDPNVSGADRDLFGLQDRLLARREGNVLEPVGGPLGQPGFAPRSVAVNLTGTQVAAVGRNGRSLLLAPLEETGGDDPKQAVRRVFRGGTDLLRPAWDFAGRIWSVDRSSKGAIIRYLDEQQRVRVVAAPQVSGRRVVAFLISRDGSRFISVVRDGRTDRLLVSRVLVDGRGVITRLSDPQQLTPDPEVSVRIRAIGWTSPTTVTMAAPSVAGQVFEIRSVAIDGSPVSADAPATVVQERLIGLATSPLPDLPAYGVTQDTLVDLDGGTYGFTGTPPTSLGYAG